MSNLLEAAKLINKKFGNKELNEFPITIGRVDVPTISTDIIGIDVASNSQGIPEGRIFEVFGPESSGKTTIALLLAKKYIKDGKPVVFIDVEQAFSSNWAEKLGVPQNDPNKFLIEQTSVFEEIFESIKTLIQIGGAKLIIVDSVAAISMQSDFESEEQVGKGMPLFAKAFRRQLRLLTSIARKNKCNILFLNHMMEDMGAKQYVKVYTSPGGTALKFLASMRMKISKSIEKDEEGNKSAVRIKVEFVKNKVGTPYGIGSFILDFENGVDRIQEIFDYSLELGITQKKGPREYLYNGEKVADTAKKFYNWIAENENIQKQLYEKIYEKMKSNIKPLDISIDDIKNDSGDINDINNDEKDSDFIPGNDIEG